MQELDKQFTSSLQLVEQIYTNRISKGNHEIETLRSESEIQKVSYRKINYSQENLANLLLKIKDLTDSHLILEQENSELIHENSTLIKENKTLVANNKSITVKYNALKKDTLKLEVHSL
jgi:hypothetical protein